MNVGLDLGIAGVLFYIHSHRVLCGSFFGTKNCSVWLAGSAHIHIVDDEGISRMKGGKGLWIDRFVKRRVCEAADLQSDIFV